MSPVLEKALTALFTDPATEELMTQAQASRLGIRIGLAISGVLLAIALALGAGA